ncbi:DUF4190 domain-containing protein [Mycolicibacterium brumae]|uniref:DUF4190 domain-containing protein n=1 Tax=Mycolicibacterium brumae TaxID=85968 RepID=A0A2G5PAS7_9MYCO|nr:DUF4190 domain-containing protein [Mycolicibacterium brumae]MCV7192114.1 DUF4190 domain-containing protein [Mycolicibacterium brumae]PIB75426.1 DUF4190 domain-containing protein [Mycolicibacterium brumae]RWA20779.1 hypothetical protein MBRU_03710 [Mycolicibacterium brumae DSM 44177]UWW07877.1 DUF4190 domain-containing protein [Mycolicibacterium brumae]
MTFPHPPSGHPQDPASQPPQGFAPVEYPAVEYPATDYPGDATQIAPPAYNPSSYPQQAPFAAPPSHPQGQVGPSYPPGYAPPPMPSPYYGGYDPYGAPGVPMGTNGKAIASLVCSLLGLFCGITSIVGIILGFLGMNETKRTGQDGYGLALAGTIIGFLWIGVWVLYVLWAIVMAASFGTSGTWT